MAHNNNLTKKKNVSVKLSHIISVYRLAIFYDFLATCNTDDMKESTMYFRCLVEKMRNREG